MAREDGVVRRAGTVRWRIVAGGVATTGALSRFAEAHEKWFIEALLR
jgi:hypothetical protein